MSDIRLSSLPIPKFHVGQKVWGITTDIVIEKWPCPDCHDTKEWTATSPAGATVKIVCLRCGNNTYGLPREVVSLARRVATFCVREYTVGSIQINTAPHDDQPVQYMCVETGVGTGRIYGETGRYALHATKEEAEFIGATFAREEQTVLDAQPQALKSEAFSKWAITVAVEREWRHDIYNAFDQARYLREHIKELVNVNDSCDCDGPKDLEDCKARLRELLSELERYSFIERHPLEDVLTTARKVVNSYNADGGLDKAVHELREALEKTKYTPYKALREEPTLGEI